MVQLLLAQEPLLPEAERITCGPLFFSPGSNRRTEHQRKRLLASLRGQNIRVPNLKPLFAHWPTKQNDQIDHMRHDIRQWLDKFNSTVSPGQTLRGLQGSDFGLFGATWWPCAPFEELKIVTYLAVWLFTWDDEIDLSNGNLWSEFSAAQSYREQTIAYVRYSLGIDIECPNIQNRIILNFEPIGTAVRERYTLEKRQMFLQEMEFFMEMSEQEQRLRLSGSIVSLEEFWRYRLGSSAVTVCLALNEYSWNGVDLPVEFYADKDVQTLFRCTNTIISAVNDLLSLQKEIKRDAIDSLIPIIFFKVGDIQVAVQQVVSFIRDEIEAMDDATESLCVRYQDADADMQRQVNQFIDGCKYYTTGNLTWSLKTDRYGVGRSEDASGDVIISL